jgi:hypothetical protein
MDGWKGSNPPPPQRPDYVLQEANATSILLVSAKGLVDLPWLGWWAAEKEDIEFLSFPFVPCNILLSLSQNLSKF